jgi:PAS domain S-box-containing protein
MDDSSRLRALLSAGPSVSYTLSLGPERAFTFISDNLKARFGVDPQELYADPTSWLDRIDAAQRQRVEEEFAAPSAGAPTRVEYQIAAPGGDLRWVADERTLIIDGDGAPVEIAGWWTDITGERHERDAARDADHFARSVVDSIPALVAYVDADQRYVFANEAYVAWFGWTTETIRGVTVREVLGDARYEWSRSYIEGALRGEYTDFEGDAPDRGHGTRYARVMYGPRRAVDGAIVGYFVVVTDLTELSRAQAALRASEGRLAAIIDTAADGIVTATEDGVIESLNTAAAAMFGLASGAGVGANVTSLMPPAERTQHNGSIGDYLTTGEGTFVGSGRTARGQRQDGSVFPLHISLSDAALPDGRRFTAIMRDMTEDVRLADELRALTAELEQRVADRTVALAREVAERRAAEEGLRHVLAAARCILWRATVRDVDGAMRWDVAHLDSEAAQRFVPLDLSDGTPWHTASVDARFSEDHDRVCTFVDSQLRGGHPSYSQEFRVTDVDGNVRWLHEDVIVEAPGPHSWYLVGVLTDVTGRREAEEEVLQSEQHFRRIFDGSPIGIVIADRDLAFVDVNPALCDYLGYSRSELLQLSMADITHADDMPLSRRTATQVGESGAGPTRVEKRYRHMDGAALWAQSTIAMLHDADGNVVGRVGMIEDIGARRRADLLQAALHGIADAVHESADMPELVRNIQRSVASLMDAEDFAVGIPNEKGEVFSRWIGTGVDRVIEPHELTHTRPGWVLRELRPLLLTREETLRRVAEGEFRIPDYDIGSWCGAPLIVDGRAIGIVRVRNNGEPAAYSETDRDFLAFVASQIALAFSRKQAQEELVTERRLFQGLMENARDSIFFKDRQSRFTRVSARDANGPRSEPADQLIGLTDFDVWPHSDAQDMYDREQQIMASGEPMLDAVTRFEQVDGQDVWVSSTKVPLTDAEGVVNGLVGITRNITPLMAAQNALEESEAQRTRLMQQIVVVQEEERARIARELHDQVGQDLASVLIGLRIVAAAEDVETAHYEASMLRERTAATLEDVRQIAFHMRPSSLDDLGLMVALERGLSDLAQDAGFAPVMRVHGSPAQRIPPDVELGIYRVVYAAISNAAVHADATTVSVLTQFSNDSVSILVEDDGRGFDTAAVLEGPVEGRFGLLAMQERAQMFQGELTIDSTPGEGTAVILEVDLAP